MSSLLTRQRLALLVTLVTLIASAYMVTYSGRIESGDSFYLFDAVGSVTDFHDFLLDLSAGTRPPQTFEHDAFYPLPSVDAEPLQIVLATPLYWLAEHLPGIGLTHAVWLFNVIVSALACGVLFLYALALDYNERTAVLAALLLAFGTIVWPYSKSFFREPLTLLMILLAAFFAERWRASHYRSLPLMLVLILALVGMLLAKATAALAFPALLIIALPTVRGGSRRVFVGLAAAILLAGGVFVLLGVFGDQLGIGRRYNPLARFIQDTTYWPIALHTYLLSIGGSVWGTSPVTLLAIPGLWMLVRQRRPRYVAAVALVVLAFAVGYAFSSGAFWFGGLSWPPRFLVPVVPFLIIGALPAINRLMYRPVTRGLLIAAVVLMVYSLWVQISAVSLAWGDYTTVLPREAHGLLEWGGGLNQVQYLRWVIIPSLWSSKPLNVAWARMNLLLWPIAFAALALVCSGFLWRLLRRLRKNVLGSNSSHGGSLIPSLLVGEGFGVGSKITVLLPLVLVAFTYVGLRAIYVDNYYFPDREGLFPILPIIDAEAGAGDIVMLSNREYERFFLNYGKLDGVRVVTLSPQPGDRPSEEQPAEVTSNNPDVLLTNLTIPFIHSMAQARDRIWLLENRGPDFAWAVRPVERFMGAHYYPIRLLQTDPPDPTVRLIEYSTVDAPDPSAFVSPATFTDLVYGDGFHLVGYTLPLGATYAAEDALPISLYWRADTPPSQDYRVAWFLRASDGSPVAQGMDSRPGGDFVLTSQWQAGVPLWDNRALRLPPDLAPGTYRLWVKVYYLNESFTPQDLPVQGAETLDGTIGVLPTIIEVR
jgi:hypothetical protein